MSRRLKHLKEEHTFFIKGQGSPETEYTILKLVDEYVIIHQKYLAKGHTKQTEIKQIEKQINFSQKDNTIQFKLSLHVSHYTNLYFNIYEYIARLNSELKLPPASIRYNVTIDHQEEVKAITADKTKSNMFI
jgi:hypothetical protein